jgi:FkbH-like protein
VLDVFDELDMPLKLNHFATWRINWQDKVTNLQSMADELNVGVDSFVFVDNNRAERQSVRMQLPEVTVLGLNNDLGSYAEALQTSLFFENGILTDEDTQRGRYYAEGRQRKEARKKMSLMDFYHSLDQRVEIRAMTVSNIPRVAQLTQKTNQFNLTTRRYTEQEIIKMDCDPHWEIFTLAANDRFGDEGITGVAILHYHSGGCELDTFLLSCRVIGRGIETAFLRWLIVEAGWHDVTWFAGEYIPTEKNVPAKDFYQRHGFVEWTRGWKAPDCIAQPEWITYD